MKKLILVLMVVALTSAFLSAEIYFKQETKTGAFMGQPAKTTYSEIWYGQNKVVIVSPESKNITDFTTKKTITITHKNKTYTEINLVDIAAMASAIESASASITVSANGQTKKVGKYDCKGFDMTMGTKDMKMKTVMWVTNNLPFDWKSFSKFYMEAYKVQYKGSEKMLQELKKMDGYPILTEVEMMGMKVSATVVDINSNKAAPADLYSIPAGYKKTSMEYMMKGFK